MLSSSQKNLLFFDQKIDLSFVDHASKLNNLDTWRRLTSCVGLSSLAEWACYKTGGWHKGDGDKSTHLRQKEMGKRPIKRRKDF